MMDYDKLIEQLNAWNEQHLSVVCGSKHFACDYLCENEDCIVVRAATALSTLQTENEKLRTAVDNWKKKYVETNGKWIKAENKWAGLDKAVRNGNVYRPMQEELNLTHEENQSLKDENEKMRAELEQKEKYYEQMIDALSATDSADLAQMTACVYYKPGGLCRYGGDDPANVCVLGPCPHERTAEEVLADLARVTAERDAAIAAVKNMAEYIVCAGRVDYYLCDEISQEHHLKYQPKNDGNYDNEPCYKCIEDWFLQGNKW